MEMLKEIAQLAEQFARSAETVDQGTTPPGEHLSLLAQAGYYHFVTVATPGKRRRALDLLSSGCGVTSFVSTQHEGVCRRLADADHPALQEAVSGSVWYGVCFAHLRRDPSPVTALEQRNEVVFSGSGPWFTGYGLMEKVMVGGATEEGHFLMGVTSMNTPDIQVSPLSGLSVMEATATVRLNFNALQVPQQDIIVKTDRQGLADKDKHSTVFQSARSLGAARAASRFLSESGADAVREALEQQHRKMDAWDESPSWETATSLRVEALGLARKVLEAAYVTVGGKAHSLKHPLQRIAREASFYSTTQLTQPLREAVTSQLIEELQQAVRL